MKNKLPIIFGIGLVLFPINFNFKVWQPLGLIPSQLGLALIVLSLMYMVINGMIKKEHLGSKWVYIPLMVIVASLIARIAVEPTEMTMAGAMVGVILFGVYLGGRVLGVAVLKPFIYATAIVSFSQIVASIASQGNLAITGGLISNYCASAGYTILGFMLIQPNKSMFMVILVGIGLFFTGAAEALFAVAVLGLIVLIRRDYGKKLVIILTMLVVVVGLSFAVGIGQKIYQHASNNLKAASSIVSGDTSEYGGLSGAVDTALTNRWEVIVRAMNDIAPLGHGLELTSNNRWTVHNVPLVIVDQLGIVAGAAWLFVAIYCLIKTKWKYVWFTVLILSVFDHYIWTQFSPLFWMIVGVTTSVSIKNDYIFRNKDEHLLTE